MASTYVVGSGSAECTRRRGALARLGEGGVRLVSLLAILVGCTHGTKERDLPHAIDDTSAAPAAQASSPAAFAAPAAPEPIVVSLDALPSHAKIFVDGLALASNPYEAERPRDARTHVIRFEAPGYEPRTARVTFSEAVHLHVELVPLD